MSNKISNQRLKEIVDFVESFGRHPKLQECSEMAKELLKLRKCQHRWNSLRLVEAGGRYQYCTLCGTKRVKA